jgi:IclR family KDG regulon transcriptional repressor
VAAVLKVFAILQALSERNETGISELSVRLAMPKATVYRFLQTMKTLGYVRQEVDSERYGLTMRVFELGTKALQYPDLVEIWPSTTCSCWPTPPARPCTWAR